MKRSKINVWDVICISGIIWFFIAVASIVFLFKIVAVIVPIFYDIIESAYSPKVILIFAGMFWSIVFIRNISWLDTGRSIDLFTWMDKYRPELVGESKRKKKAQHPEVDEEFLSPVPDGLVLGKVSDKYVRVKMSRHNIQNAIIMGSAGTGKSVLLLTMLIFQQNCINYKSIAKSNNQLSISKNHDVS